MPVPPELVLLLLLLVVGLSAALSERLRVASPLLLVALGAAVAALPGVPAVQVEPELVLSGILPPLLYAAAVQLPAMGFRRDASAISGLSVALVLLSAVSVGALLSWLLGVGFWWGVALGAVVSPTDAVATSIVKGLGASPRAVALLEGEGLLNDATALVLLRTAVAVAAAGTALGTTDPSVGSAVGDFAWAVALAVVVGLVVGHLDLVVRRRLDDPAAGTLVSFAVPFAASLPVEHLGGSGLVAAVVAGLVTNHHAPRVLTPRARLSDSQTWRSASLLLEGGIFLLMGLELPAVLEAVAADPDTAGGVGELGLGRAALVAAAALAAVLAVRALFVAGLLALSHRRRDRRQLARERFSAVARRFEDRTPAEVAAAITARRALDGPAGRVRGGLRRGGLRGAWRAAQRRPVTEEAVSRITTRLRRVRADLDYLLDEPLGWREGVVVVWAGMRGAVTVAAAQTLPEDAPQRELLVLVAYLVAAGSLLLQGLTLRRVVLAVGSTRPRGEAEVAEQQAALVQLVADAGRAAVVPDGTPPRQARLLQLRAQRDALLDARDEGSFDAEALSRALDVVDADEISLTLRDGGAH
ncbi:sodium:proton antiporter [Quadrisphaera setariae]|uniref:Sodium:proton antiporter n=1 Tax=Quadrisphaera setariae TaxID=2593304 RepID=A0A5C8ZFP3_9ACTN|nr:sodium:proton antiporter [Quadrisphaera setariae]